MPRRGYDMRRRTQAVDGARLRVLAAAYELLKGAECRDISLEAVARAAGVTRMTLYNQFGSRTALLVALFQDLARRMKADRIYEAMRLPDPRKALSATLEESTRAYAREAPVIRKLFALAVLDRDVATEVRRAERQRRRSLVHLAVRLVESRDSRLDAPASSALLAALTSFQAFEAVAFDGGPRLTERRIFQLARAGLGFPNEKGKTR